MSHPLQNSNGSIGTETLGPAPPYRKAIAIGTKSVVSRVVLLGLLAVMAVGGGMAGAQDGSATEGKPVGASETLGTETSAAAPLSNEAIREIVLRLGANSFGQREAATAELLLIGTKSLAILRQMKDVSDPEMRRRIEVISSRILNDDFESRSEAFLDGEEGATMPGWDYVRPRFGSKLQHREVFVEFSRRHPGVVMMLDGGKEELNQALLLLAADLAPPMKEPNIAQLFGLVLLSSDLEVQSRLASDILIFSLMRRYEITTALRDPELMKPIREMLNQWITKTSPELEVDALVMALQWELEASLSLAKKILETETNINGLQRAFQVLARFGTPSDSSIAKTFLDDKRQVGEGFFYTDINGRRLGVTLGDVAMATIATLNKRNLRDVGFPQPSMHPLLVFDIDSLGFPLGESGDEARQRVRDEIDRILAVEEPKTDSEK